MVEHLRFYSKIVNIGSTEPVKEYNRYRLQIIIGRNKLLTVHDKTVYLNKKGKF